MGFLDNTLVDDETLRKRQVWCNQCDRNWHGFCKECGCYLNIKDRLRQESCPLGKWPALKFVPLSQLNNK